jgi:hypothetical protein
MTTHIAAHEGAWAVVALGLVATMLLLRKYRRDVADWNAAHPHRSFGGAS